eukprot:GHVU01070465.1.p1 GENE.GHVU01070465.1~~GHVU01070465.1.p1  ORF type:complete len:125 (+),score=11.77 GHVU01070465.1:253-627(+)
MQSSTSVPSLTLVNHHRRRPCLPVERRPRPSLLLRFCVLVTTLLVSLSLVFEHDIPTSLRLLQLLKCSVSLLRSDLLRLSNFTHAALDVCSAALKKNAAAVERSMTPGGVNVCTDDRIVSSFLR